MFGNFCGLDNHHAYSVFRSDFGVVLCLSLFIMVIEWSYMVPMVCELIHAQQESTKAYVIL